MTRADRQAGELLADALDAYLQHPAKLNPILRLDNLQNMRPSQPRGLDLGAFVTQLQARINLLNEFFADVGRRLELGTETMIPLFAGLDAGFRRVDAKTIHWPSGE